MHIHPSELAPPAASEVQVRTLYSGVRHVTDLAMLEGHASPAQSGEPLKAWCVAEVIDGGPSSNGIPVGEKVHGLMTHATIQNVSMAYLSPIDWLRPEFAVFVDPGVAALRCIRKGDIQYGDKVLISGMGAVGLMAMQYARLSGATEVIAIDRNPDRLRIAQRLGADEVYVTNSPQFDVQNGRMDVALDLSGYSDPLRMSARSLSVGGRLIAGAHYYENLDSQAFMEIANHTELVFESMFKADRDYAIESLVIHSLNNQHAIVWPIISHIIPFKNAPQMYAEMKQDPHKYLKVLLTYDD